MSKQRHNNMDKSLYFLSITLKLFSSNILSDKLFWPSALSVCRLGEAGPDISLGSSLLRNHCPHCQAVHLSFQFLCQTSPFFSCPQEDEQEITIVSPEDMRQATSVASGHYNVCKGNNKLSFEKCYFPPSLSSSLLYSAFALLSCLSLSRLCIWDALSIHDPPPTVHQILPPNHYLSPGPFFCWLFPSSTHLSSEILSLSVAIKILEAK